MEHGICLKIIHTNVIYSKSKLSAYNFWIIIGITTRNGTFQGNCRRCLVRVQGCKARKRDRVREVKRGLSSALMRRPQCSKEPRREKVLRFSVSEFESPVRFPDFTRDFFSAPVFRVLFLAEKIPKMYSCSLASEISN